MSRSRRKKRRAPSGCGPACWFCDPALRRRHYLLRRDAEEKRSAMEDAP